MRKVVYDVAMTLDGFICRDDGSIDGFVPEGPHVDDYLKRLKQYDTVLMGRRTYEFGYQFGLEPGARAYPHMEHYVFSDSLRFDAGQVQVVERDRLDVVRRLKESRGSAIYLCGGGAFAQVLLEHNLIDQLILKLNPIVFGTGVRVFGESAKQIGLSLWESQAYDNGVTLLCYDVRCET